MKRKKKLKRKGRMLLTALVLLAALAIFSVIFAPNLVDQGYEWMYPLSYKDEIVEKSEQYDVDPHLMLALIRTESSFDSAAVSSAGAIGLAQIMPDTGQWLADKLGMELYSEDMLYIPDTNIELSCYYMSILIERFGNVDTALAAYNAGMGTVSGWLEDTAYSEDGVTLIAIPYEETRDYVERINSAMVHYKELYPEIGSSDE